MRGDSQISHCRWGVVGRVVVIAAVTLAALTIVSVAPASAAPQVGQGAGSVTQAYLTGATPGASVVLRDGGGRQVGAGRVDRLGSFLVRDLTPGSGYSFIVDGRAGNVFRVLDETPPPTNLYNNQSLHPGLNYIRMRDGITLAAVVRLPVGKTMADGPFPTVIEYSGYQIAAPNDFVLGAAGSALNRPDPAAPAISTLLGGITAPASGFASVNVQMRGSGCSGGAFDLFDYPTIYDGYDAIETVGRQPWVSHHKVGMVGISFSGISQIAVAGTRPPSLAAIAPMSTTDDLYSTGFPGGIFNAGFANSWLNERQEEALPAPQGGQPYPRVAIANGDRTCAANQRLRLQTQNIQKLVADNPTRTPSIFDHRAPAWWASRINVPVYLSGSLQDEQTGPQWTSIIPQFANNPNVWVKMINGSHFDSMGPQILGPWYEFLNLFVADRVPPPRPELTALGPVIYLATTSTPGRSIVTDRLSGSGSLAAAKARFARDPRITVFFGNGTQTSPAGNLSAPVSAGYGSWPPASVGDGTRLSLNTDGRLGDTGPSGRTSFRPDPAARPAGSLDVTGPSMVPWGANPPYKWAPVTGSNGLGFTSAPAPTSTVVVGPASLDLQLSSTAPDTDLQATLSEVRPDGTEQYVASGFLHASLRATDSAATALVPSRTWTGPQPLSGVQTVRIALNPVGHIFAKGSRIRVTITAPGGDRPSWRFATPQTHGKVVDTVELGVGGSSLVLPVVRGATTTLPAAPCASMRGEPCRKFIPAGNGG